MANETSNIIHEGNESFKLLKWKVKPGSLLLKGNNLLLCEYLNLEQNVKKTYKANTKGTVKQLVAKEGDIIKPGDKLLELHSGCRHLTFFKDMCAECGAVLNDLEIKISTHIAKTVSMVHSVPDLRVYQQEAETIGQEDTRSLLASRKLVLLVDLDQTLIHTTYHPVRPNIKDVFHFQLNGPQSPWFHTRVRPGTREFLEKMSALYELHICTFGTRLYAHTIAKHLDPSRKYFYHRILSRNECFDPTSKTGNLKALFPCGDAMVCIIDDREDVWNYAPNLVPVKPYVFFQNTGDINAAAASLGNTSLRRKRKLSCSSVESESDMPATLSPEVPKVEKESKASPSVGKENGSAPQSKIPKIDASEEKATRENNIPIETEVPEGQTPSSQDQTDRTSRGAEPDSAQSGAVRQDVPPSTPSTMPKGEITKVDNIPMETEISKNQTDSPSQGAEPDAAQSGAVRQDVPPSTPPTMPKEEITKVYDIPMETEVPGSQKPAQDQTDSPSQGTEPDAASQDVPLSNPSTTPEEEVTKEDTIPMETEVPEGQKLSQDQTASPSQGTEPDAAQNGAVCQDVPPPTPLTMPKEEITKEDDVPMETKIPESQKPGQDQTDSPSQGTEPDAAAASRDMVPPSTPPTISQEEDDDHDDYLLYLEDILTRVHSEFFKVFDEKNAPGQEQVIPDLKKLIPEIKSKILVGTRIMFSGVIPTNSRPEKNKLWYMAKSLGAEMVTELCPKNGQAAPTHLVAAKWGTAKVNRALHTPKLHLVTPHWLSCCAERWEHVDELIFALSKDTNYIPPKEYNNYYEGALKLEDEDPSTSTAKEEVGHFRELSTAMLKEMGDEVEQLLGLNDSMDEESMGGSNRSDESTGDDDDDELIHPPKSIEEPNYNDMNKEELSKKLFDPDNEDTTSSESYQSDYSEDYEIDTEYNIKNYESEED